MNSLSQYDNENDFQRLMQGEASLRSANSQMAGLSDTHGNNYNPNIHSNAIDQANNLLIQMQQSQLEYQRAQEPKGYQPSAHMFADKENFNNKNMESDLYKRFDPPSTYEKWDQYDSNLNNFAYDQM